MPDLDALLGHIGLDSAPEPTLAGLDTLQRAFVSRVPFEDLAIHLGETEQLDLDRVAARVLAGGRGGYCFELNGLLGWMLERLGFAVERRESVVGPRGAPGRTNHLGLVVTPADAGPRIAEAGLGPGPMTTLPLQAGPHGSPIAWTLHPERNGGWYWEAPAHAGLPGVAIGATAVDYAAFAPHHERVSTSPDSIFVQTIVVQRPYDDRTVALRARTLSADGPGVRERRRLDDVAELAGVLHESFGIDPSVLGTARLERLWERACVQHEAWERARATA